MVRVRTKSNGVEINGIFGSRKVIGHPFSIGNKVWCVVVECACGRIDSVRCSNLSGGQAGICRQCSTAAAHQTHGDAGSRLYNIWLGIKKRCENRRSEKFNYYGGRGVSVCVEWREYEPFRKWSIENGYDDSRQIDRFPDQDGNYDPSNCRWVTSKQNNRNRRNNRKITAFGETKVLSEWAEDLRCVVSYDTLHSRSTSGWDSQRAITQPTNARFSK